MLTGADSNTLETNLKGKAQDKTLCLAKPKLYILIAYRQSL